MRCTAMLLAQSGCPQVELECMHNSHCLFVFCPFEALHHQSVPCLASYKMSRHVSPHTGVLPLSSAVFSFCQAAHTSTAVWFPLGMVHVLTCPFVSTTSVVIRGVDVVVEGIFGTAMACLQLRHRIAALRTCLIG